MWIDNLDGAINPCTWETYKANNKKTVNLDMGYKMNVNTIK